MTLCTPCYNYEQMNRPSDIKYTPTLTAAETCGRCGATFHEERAKMLDAGEGYEQLVGDGLTFNEYQQRAQETAMGYADPQNAGVDHDIQTAELFLATGVTGEAGEFAEKIKKAKREDDSEYIDDAVREVGDIIWYLGQFCTLEGVDFGSVARDNLAKLLDRQDRDVITGEGDHR